MDVSSPDFKGWNVTIGGLVANPLTLDVRQLAALFQFETRVYRHRCVEARPGPSDPQRAAACARLSFLHPAAVQRRPRKSSRCCIRYLEAMLRSNAPQQCSAQRR